MFAAPANADRVYRHVCDDYGFCQSRCFDTGDRLYMYDGDMDYYYDHRSPSIEL